MKAKRRKAERVYDDDKEGESLMPVRKTKEIAETHFEAKKHKKKSIFPNVFEKIGQDENGKENFDFLLTQMIIPEEPTTED